MASVAQWILGLLLILSSIGVIVVPKPVHASLSFLFALLMLAALYVQLSAHFIAAMQILVYAGAILVIFMFVIVLFQDAHQQIAKYKPKSAAPFLAVTAFVFVLGLYILVRHLIHLPPATEHLPKDFGSVQSLGMSLYLDYFFPFEAVILLFLVAIIGALYTGKKGA